MASGFADTIEHPLASLVAEITDTLERHGSGPAWTVAPSALPDLLADLVAAENALDSVRLRLLREADRHQLGEAAGHTSTANWWGCACGGGAPRPWPSGAGPSVSGDPVRWEPRVAPQPSALPPALALVRHASP